MTCPTRPRFFAPSLLPCLVAIGACGGQAAQTGGDQNPLAAAGNAGSSVGGTTGATGGEAGGSGGATVTNGSNAGNSAAPAPDGEPCSGAEDCESGICEGEGCESDGGTCVPELRACTRDLREYCGCDGETFSGSGSCPGQRYQSTGPCE